MSENEMKVVVPEGFVVMVNGVRMAPALGTEQNPAKNREELPDGTGLVVMTNGTKFWFKNNKLHREDGPAVEWSNGTKEWYKNGERHREDGPAIEWASGSKFWYLNGEKLSEAEFLKATQKNGKNDPEGTAKDTDSAITPNEFPVGSEQNPANNLDELPDGTGVVVYEDGDKHWYKNGAFHREDGPAVERSNGTKEWWVNGKLHREDGPAVKRSNGTKKWYLNGELHREDGPATEWANGEKEWYKNGVLHREDGPAVDLNGYKEYWLHGERMTEAEFIEWSKGPAKDTDSAISPDEFPVGSEQNPANNLDELPDGTGVVVYEDGDKHWYKNGAFHREDGPAVERASGSKEWYMNGELHREDGPAVERANGSKEWYKNGELHREDGPAVEYSNGEKEYCIHGEYMEKAEFLERTKGTANTADSTITTDEFPVGSEHNPAKDRDELPDGTGIVVNGRGSKFWYKNGALHREDGPAVERASGRKEWYKNDERHREDGPAVEWSDGSKFWYLNGELHREDGPAVEYSTNGEKEWYKNGERHREDGPAVERASGTKEWWVNGKLHREDSPAVERSNGTKFWYKNGELHREDGPAVEYMDGYKEYFLNGFSVPAELFPHIKFVTE